MLSMILSILTSLLSIKEKRSLCLCAMRRRSLGHQIIWLPRLLPRGPSSIRLRKGELSSILRFILNEPAIMKFLCLRSHLCPKHAKMQSKCVSIGSAILNLTILFGAIQVALQLQIPSFWTSTTEWSKKTKMCKSQFTSNALSSKTLPWKEWSLLNLWTKLRTKTGFCWRKLRRWWKVQEERRQGSRRRIRTRIRRKSNSLFRSPGRV